MKLEPKQEIVWRREEEAFPRAAEMLADAGWLPHPEYGVYTRGTLVMGVDPPRWNMDVKDWGKLVHGPDYPDDPIEAAAWLIQKRAIPADVVTLDYAPEAEQTPVHDDHGASDHGSEALGGSAGADGAGEDTGRAEDGTTEHGSGADGAGYVEADFEPIPNLPEIELIPPDPNPDFGAELLEFEGELGESKEEAPSGAFIFGDNLDQKRTAAIGLVVQIALQKMPAITPADDARLAELRNFTLGVSEGRWANDAGKQAELEGLELIASLARQVEATRDAKVAFLVAASREQIEAFDPESDWPQ